MVACLDYANENAKETVRSIGLQLMDKLSLNINYLVSLIDQADIVLIHWWNHPLLYDFLVRTPLPPARVIMWSHISGFNPPYVFTGKILHYPDFFTFTTPVSYETKEVRALSQKEKKSLRVVWSTGGIDHVKKAEPQIHSGFNIGYIGTVDYCKMHPDFLEICSLINVPDKHFIVCGGPEEEKIKHQAEKMGISEKITFTGQVSDITGYFSLFDVFGYPLAPYHYGTCDQVLAESMAAGIVPVVMGNRMETYMIQDGKTGMVAKDKFEYVAAIEKLYHNTVLRESLSCNAKKYAQETISLEILTREWNKIFEEILLIPKTPRKWEILVSPENISAADVFIESLGEYGNDFLQYINAQSKEEKDKRRANIAGLASSYLMQASTRGTAHHYHEFFPNDVYLSEWSKMMKE